MLTSFQRSTRSSVSRHRSKPELHALASLAGPLTHVMSVGRCGRQSSRCAARSQARALHVTGRPPLPGLTAIGSVAGNLAGSGELGNVVIVEEAFELPPVRQAA